MTVGLRKGRFAATGYCQCKRLSNNLNAAVVILVL